MSPHHQHKRPYAGSQPSITSYFPPAVSPTSTVQPNYSISPQISYPEAPTPALPAAVQSNLLQVGMRIRKSVPEGYKTSSPFSVFSDSAPTTPMEQQRAEVRLEGDGNIPRSNRPRARELEPWCGIHKTGGLAQQQALDDYMDDDYVPQMSQCSTVSNDSVDTPDRKRRLDFDEEDKDDCGFDFTFSPGTLSPGLMGNRLMAVPKRRKGGVNPSATAIRQENMASDVDFEEADFLDYDLIEDSTMSGV